MMKQWPEQQVPGIDIVFCVDATEAMQPCLRNLRCTIDRFVMQLEMRRETGSLSRPNRGLRIRLLPFRDLDVDGEYGIVETFDFVCTAAEFSKQLETTNIHGGGDMPESGLDALYRAAKNSKWREVKEAYRFVVLFSDAPTHPILHPSTLEGPNDLKQVVQVLKLNKIKPIVVARDCAEYKAVSETWPSLKSQSRFFESFEEAMAFFLRGDKFLEYMDELAIFLKERYYLRINRKIRNGL